METAFDVIVLGGGPAGLTAGLYLARARVKTLVLDSGSAGGQVILSHQIANYPGAPEISGSQLARTMLKQARAFGCTVLTQAQITSLDLASPLKRVEVEGEGVFTARAVILATGGRSRTLGLESETRLRGKGISYCATCDGDFFADKEIVAIGGGNSALEESVSLTKYASKVTIIHEFDHFQAQAWAVDEARANPKISFLMEQTVLGFEGEEGLEAVVTAHKKTGEVTRTPAAGAFIFIGYVPNTESLRDQVACNERGEILTDEHLATNVPGVFAAGDCRVKRHRQITTAVADGTIAAMSATDFLK
jgi:thioredoxin reductase (NADPH)